jgi:hypothetical protein
MNIVLDIIGSLAIRGAIVLVILRLNLSLHQTLYLKSANANVRKIADEMVSIIETDFRQAGYNVSTAAFVQYDTSNVQFLADRKNTGTVDTIQYYLSGKSVYRKVTGSTARLLADNVAQFRFDYFGATGLAAISSTDIKSIKLKVTLQESYQLTLSSDGKQYYPSAKSEYQFFPPNL